MNNNNAETPWFMKERRRVDRHSLKKFKRALKWNNTKDKKTKTLQNESQTPTYDTAKLEDVQDYNAALKNYKLVVCECCKEKCELNREIMQEQICKDGPHLALT